MALFNRDQGLKGNNRGHSGEVVHANMHRNDPFAQQFDPNVGSKPTDLVNYLLAGQKKFYGQTIMDEEFEYIALLSHAKTLLKKYKPLAIKRAIALAVLRTDRPFSFKRVESVIKDG